MSYINSCSVYINGINRTGEIVMPLKWGDFLDERLDECVLSPRRSKRENFSPLTPVEIHLSNKYYRETGSAVREETASEEERTKYYLVSNDEATENPIGSGYHDHNLALIEVTKYAECVVCDTNTCTNDLGKNYTEDAQPVVPVES